MGDFLSEHTST